MTGFFARVEDPGRAMPSWSSSGPEIIDVSITGVCNGQCVRCYRSSSPIGSHMRVEDYALLLRQAQAIGVHQVALGGGNPNEHPEFCSILRMTRERFGIVPSYSTNGSGLDCKVLNASAAFCGAVAVSYYPPKKRFAQALSKLVKHGVRTNIHFVLDAYSVDIAIELLRQQPDYLRNTNAIVFLNYKPVGRGGEDMRLLRHSRNVEMFLILLPMALTHSRLDLTVARSRRLLP